MDVELPTVYGFDEKRLESVLEVRTYCSLYSNRNYIELIAQTLVTIELKFTTTSMISSTLVVYSIS